ncbi:uncharacterized protein N7483_010839 [Penicillium malachiteum]|uniref:uncharacterized protein n=1 Tax=Penicillium malachiteum TaxID=1324776 RepID=UPI0025473870|nr:uncharacterized protein N7483_010839 [Penicillium malachiteum]KAJ5713658.1 hypothetical protein N7483_010839 [Penicillium malachiteum]
MAVPFQTQSGKSDLSSDYRIDMPSEVYTDSSVFTENVKSAANVQVNIPHGHVGPRASLWHRVLAWTPSFSTRKSSGAEDEDLPLLTGNILRRRRLSCGSRFSRYLGCSLLFFFLMLGVLQFISLACGIILSFFPDEYDRAASRWARTGDQINTKDINEWPTDISRDIIPLGCHSHNDYWRRVPLYSALQAGCIGVEADVWFFDNELYVGHTSASLTSRRTLRSMYIEPLLRILEQQNPTSRFQPSISNPPHGVFDTNPDQTLVLLIDFKTDGESTWPAVEDELAPFRERGYLTYFDGENLVPGPITVVGTGNTPFNMVTANSTYRDIFFDAPLDKLVDANKMVFGMPGKQSLDLGQGQSGMPDVITAQTFNMTNSYYASVSFQKAIGFPWPFHLSQHQLGLIRSHVRIAHQHGLKVRYWGLPSWPLSLRNHIWRILVQEGVDMLNVDDLVGATKGDWKIKIFDWWW